MPSGEITLRLGDRNIIEMGVVTALAELLGDAERAQQFRLFEQEADENLLVEKVEAEMAKPDQVNDEYCRNQEGGSEKRAESLNVDLSIGASLTDFDQAAAFSSTAWRSIGDTL